MCVYLPLCPLFAHTYLHRCAYTPTINPNNPCRLHGHYTPLYRGSLESQETGVLRGCLAQKTRNPCLFYPPLIGHETPLFSDFSSRQTRLSIRTLISRQPLTCRFSVLMVRLAMKTCTETNCPNPHKARGLCAKHYQAALYKKALDTHTLVRQYTANDGTHCKVFKCQKPHYRYGWCHGHRPNPGLRCRLCKWVQAQAVCPKCSSWLEGYKVLRERGVQFDALDKALDMVLLKGTLDPVRGPVVSAPDAYNPIRQQAPGDPRDS